MAWYTEQKEIQELERSINLLTFCSGKCKDCGNCKMKFADTDRGTAYAFYCDLQPDFMQIMSNSPLTLRKDTLEGLEFELS